MVHFGSLTAGNRVTTHVRALAIAIALCVGGGVIPSSQRAAPAVADLVLRNGRVFTIDDDNRVVSAVAIAGNRIVAVGDDQGIGRWVGAETESVDLRGRVVVPGFIDAHSHVSSVVESERLRVPIAVPPLRNVEEIIAALRARQKRLPRGAWIVGQGTFNQVMPTRQELDEAFPDNPVDLWWSAHDHLINHRAAVELGLNKDTPEPRGAGRFERTADGEPMILRDADVAFPRPHLSEAEMKEGLRDVLIDKYLRHGVTTVADLSGAAGLRHYRALHAEGRLPVRVNVSFITRGEGLDTVLSGPATGAGDDWIRIGAIKLFADGVWGTTAAVYKPFWQGSGTTWIPNNRGGLEYGQEQMNRVVLEAHRAGWQVWVHANGDRAQDQVLDAFENAQAVFPRADSRHRIEHFANFLVQDPERTAQRLARMKRGNVIPSTTVAFLWRLTDTNVEEPDVKFFPMKTLIDLGFRPPGAPDMTGSQRENSNPLFSVERAVARTTKYGTVVQPEEAVSVLDGIRMFTRWSAYANFLETSRGTIEVNKLADLVVLRTDPFTAAPDALDDIAVDLTILDGRIVHRAPR